MKGIWINFNMTKLNLEDFLTFAEERIGADDNIRNIVELNNKHNDWLDDFCIVYAFLYDDTIGISVEFVTPPEYVSWLQ